MVAGGDYEDVIDQIIMFEAGDVTQTHRIIINQDMECEIPPNENLFSNIALNSGISDISVIVPRATVTINDYEEEECSEFQQPIGLQHLWKIFCQSQLMLGMSSHSTQLVRDKDLFDCVLSS